MGLRKTSYPTFASAYDVILRHRPLLVNNNWALSTVLPSLGINSVVVTFIYHKTSVFTYKMANHFPKHKCLVLNKFYHINVKAKRWQHCAESLNIIYH